MSTTAIEEEKPGVIIVGAGIASLMLAILLEQLGYPYHIFERATKLRPLGSAMTLGANILPVFEQLGMLEDLRQISHPCYALNIYDADSSLIGAIKLIGREGTGYDDLLFERPRFHELLFKRIPSSKISLGKKVLRTEEKEGRVFIHCSDNTTYEGDILIGADGAYSGIRQSMYKQLDEQGTLPKSDKEELSIASVIMVGVAAPADVDRYPQLKDDFAHFTSALGNDLTGVTLVSVPGNRICWAAMGKQLSQDEGKQQQFRNSEWGPESNESMMKEFEDRMTPWGVTMGDVMSATPKDLISKVYLEEKMFETWYHGRTVLIGDACHKMLPGAGQGAVNAMQDAVVLANCIYNMPDSKPVSITAAFREYRRQRYPLALREFKRSSSWTKVCYGKTWTDRLIRQISLNVPYWIQRQAFIKDSGYRPQIAWLPLAENRGYAPVLPQESRRKMDEKDSQSCAF